jgi:hypothetical protein
MNLGYSPGLYWLNVPGREDHLGFLSVSQLRLHVFKNINTPSFIYTGTNFINEFNNLEVSSEISELDIYFFEPLCFKLSTNEFHNRSFYSEFKGDELVTDLRSDELDSVEQFRVAHGIKSINVYTCEYRIQLLQPQYPNLKLHCFDIFLRSLNHPPKYNTIQHNISKKFWCSNWRYATHRHLSMSHLVNIEGNYSWHIKCELDKLRENVWFDLEKLENSDPMRFLKLVAGSAALENSDLRIDRDTSAVTVDKFNSVSIPGNIAPAVSTEFIKSYAECFCAVVNETRFAQPFGNISEKTLNPLRAKLPLILVAPPYSLEYLKTFGFKTFDRWWDESYDIEENHEQRMLKILDVIDFIDNKSLDELREIYNEMSEILAHNHHITKWFKINTNLKVL